MGGALAIAGLLLLALSLGQYGFMYYRQRQLQREWRQLDAGAASAAGTAAASASTPSSTDKIGSGLLKLVIPRIQLNDIIVPGTSYQALLEGPGWMRSSSPPGKGNTIIAGHRDTFFRGIHELQPGDAIRIESGSRTYRYRVVSRRIVASSDTSALDSTPKPMLTLVTCYPTYWIGPAPKRLIVQARLQSK